MKYMLRRLAMFVVALIVISIIVFVMLRILPGDIAAVMAGTNATPERVAALREQMGLNKPLVSQYFDWIGGLFHGDFGESMLTGQPVATVVGSRAAITFPLIVMGMAVALLIGIPLGYLSVRTTNRVVQSIYQSIAIIGGAIPALWGGLLLILLFAKGVGILPVFPAQGFPSTGWANPGKALMSLILPALTVGIIVGATIMRYTRASFPTIPSSGYVELAMARGMPRRKALWHVGLRLAMPQLVSVVGLTFAEMITGVMVIENLFALPGIGTGLVSDLGHRDLIAVQSELFMLAAFFLVIGLLVDLAHRALDPRLGEESND